VNGPVFDLATTLSKFLHLGLTLEQVIERAATNPAQTFGLCFKSSAKKRKGHDISLPITLT
jgi:dihydroorotase